MRIWVKRILIVLITLTVVLFAMIGPIDRTPLHEQPFYNDTQEQLSQLQFHRSINKTPLQSGWGKITITPDHPMQMAGYLIRENFDSVHDSLYARILMLKAAEQRIIMISVDLLLFPPALKNKLETHFRKSDSNPFLYLSATHTHNGIGCWHNSMVGNIALGHYDEDWVTSTADKIIQTIESIESNLLRTSLSYWENDASEYVENRLQPGATYDGKLRGIKLSRSDNQNAILFSFSAHPTSISKRSKSLSGDYPAAIIDSLSKKANSFGMFMAGMVGSHRLTGMSHEEFELLAEAGDKLSDKILTASYSTPTDSIRVLSAHIPIIFGPSQLRISHNWKIRDWLFSYLVHPLQGELTYLQLDDLIMIGTPCDFSGEIFVDHIAEIADQENKKVMLTSFNGNYVGYITEDKHYETLKKEEVMALNWVGPYYGTYFTDIITKLLKK